MSDNNNEIVDQLEKGIKAMLDEYGVEYHRFECRNFSDLNCDMTLQIHRNDIFPTFIYSSLGRIQDNIESDGMDAVIKSHCRIVLKMAYESYHARVSENRRIVQSKNYTESLINKAREDLKHQEPLFEKLQIAWNEWRD